MKLSHEDINNLALVFVDKLETRITASSHYKLSSYDDMQWYDQTFG